MGQQQQQYQSYHSRQINLILHVGDEQIPLAIYPGTSEQAIYENIRELTNLYRFRCFTQNQQPMILSANLPNNTHIFIAEPLKKKSDEPSPKEQAEYLKNKVHEIIDA